MLLLTNSIQGDEMNTHLMERFSSARIGDTGFGNTDLNVVPTSAPTFVGDIREYFGDASKPVIGGGMLAPVHCRIIGT
jgi:hypothetical protein